MPTTGDSQQRCALFLKSDAVRSLAALCAALGSGAVLFGFRRVFRHGCALTWPAWPPLD
jgi:hypothetical protein